MLSLFINYKLFLRMPHIDSIKNWYQEYYAKLAKYENVIHHCKRNVNKQKDYFSKCDKDASYFIR